jgi:hypothetical protein
MKMGDILSFLQNTDLHTFYPFSFPSSNEPCTVVDIAGGTVERGGVNQLTLRILTRESHPSFSIDKAHEIRKYLYKNLKGAFFNGKKILNIETDTPQPLIIGEEDGLYTVSWNYTVLEG